MEGRVNIALTSPGKNIGCVGSTRLMYACLGTRSFFLVSSDSASAQRETKHCLVAHLLCAKAMQKDQHEVFCLSPAQKRRQEELHSLQHTSDTESTSSLLMRRDRGPKEVCLTEM